LKRVLVAASGILSHNVLKLRSLLGIYMGIMAKATWEGAVLAESDKTVEVEGNQYFPPDAIRKEYFRPSEQHTVCPWKGAASYYDVEVKGQRNAGAAWYYPEPKAAAKQIKGYVAFWNGTPERLGTIPNQTRQPSRSRGTSHSGRV
jgi:uncharacterized protein (DUF427 family)